MGKLRVSDGIDLHYGGIQEGGAGLTDGSRNLTIATGASAGKFAVMNATVHGSYDFYNNGTSYFNGSVIVDESFNVTGSGRAIKMNGTTRINSDGHFITAGNLYFGATDSSLLAKDTANIRYMADGQHKFETYSGGWGRRVDIDDSGLNIVSGHAIRHNATTVLNSSRQLGNIDRNYLSNNYSGTYINASGSYLQIQTSTGYTRIGSANTTYSHFYTDRGTYYFNKQMNVDGDIRPHTTNARSLGNTSLRWNNGYIREVIFNSASGAVGSIGQAGSGGDVEINSDHYIYFIESDANVTKAIWGLNDPYFTFGQTTLNTSYRMYVNGSFAATADVTAYASDERLKTNIVKIDSAVEKIKQLRGVTFDWIDDVEEKGFEPSAKHETGVIAQEVQKVIPDAVVPAPFDPEYWTVKHEKIIPVLIEAIKEQQEQIDKLTSIINEKGE